MITKYLIEEQTLTDIADSIRYQENSNESINVEKYAERIKNIELPTEVYMYLIDVASEDVTTSDTIYSDAEIDATHTLLLKLYNTEGVI